MAKDHLQIAHENVIPTQEHPTSNFSDALNHGPEAGANNLVALDGQQVNFQLPDGWHLVSQDAHHALLNIDHGHGKIEHHYFLVNQTNGHISLIPADQN